MEQRQSVFVLIGLWLAVVGLSILACTIALRP